MGKGSREEKKPKKVVEKGNASAPSVKGLPAGPVKSVAAPKAGGQKKK
ncbi:hypothetical protein [Aureimonas pseudogalii]|jgi:hypothetical protein|uniref:Uncharacterized protein n=1 Tax=Aureimonas pseudogalii TaxID=1744844 RepID=A0A7W6E7L3_9HYPH|nr:hypothetical protein [Aureimonas pseudogalii]MBB3996216.1 hypothetical protein [Aureimonas pseudogalii]